MVRAIVAYGQSGYSVTEVYYSSRVTPCLGLTEALRLSTALRRNLLVLACPIKWRGSSLMHGRFLVLARTSA
jgi:hypothetical protein